jgi:hypothetical protein
MRKLAIALLTTSMFVAPAAFAASSNQQPSQGQQMKQGQQMQHNQSQNQPNTQSQRQQPNGQPQQSAENTQPIQPQSMSRGQVRQVQQALDKDGFKAGRADGRWGSETQAAVKQFQQSKQLQPTGQLNEQTVADLGLDTSKFQQQQNQQR